MSHGVSVYVYIHLYMHSMAAAEKYTIHCIQSIMGGTSSTK